MVSSQARSHRPLPAAAKPALAILPTTVLRRVAALKACSRLPARVRGRRARPVRRGVAPTGPLVIAGAFGVAPDVGGGRRSPPRGANPQTGAPLFIAFGATCRRAIGHRSAARLPTN